MACTRQSCPQRKSIHPSICKIRQLSGWIMARQTAADGKWQARARWSPHHGAKRGLVIGAGRTSVRPPCASHGPDAGIRVAHKTWQRSSVKACDRRQQETARSHNKAFRRFCERREARRWPSWRRLHLTYDRDAPFKAGFYLTIAFSRQNAGVDLVVVPSALMALIPSFSLPCSSALPLLHGDAMELRCKQLSFVGYGGNAPLLALFFR